MTDGPDAATPDGGVTCDSNDDCDDGFYCNGEEICDEGVCGTLTTCPEDDLGCTFCDEDTDECDALLDGHCLIDSGMGPICYEAGALNPDNGCQECYPSSDEWYWTDDNANACDDGDACTEGDYCSFGGCAYENWSECPPDGDDCTSDACVSGPGCVYPDEPDETWCDDDLYCNGPDACDSGACAAVGPAPCAADALACTTTCDEVGGCNVLQSGFCKIDDVCYAAGDVNPDNACQECYPTSSTSYWTNDNTNGCSDDDPCTTGDYCSFGSCYGAGSVTCAPDGNACTNDACQTGLGCTFPAEAAGTWCDDGLYCNGADQCSGTACASVGPAPCPDDGLTCTTTCDESADLCNVTQAGFCKIDNVCRDAGTLNPDNACQECYPSSSTSYWTNDNTNACSDGDPCTTGDYCSGGGCYGTGSVTCAPDGNQCTDDACQTGLGCTYPAVTAGTSCDDGLACNGADQCSGTVCVNVGPAPCPPDAYACTTLCTETGGSYECNRIDTGWCLIGTSCVGAGTIDPGNPCQECYPASSTTSWTADNTNPCSDGDACTTGDYCSGGWCYGGTDSGGVSYPPGAGAACWYLGISGANCQDTCAGRGGPVASPTWVQDCALISMFGMPGICRDNTGMCGGSLTFPHFDASIPESRVCSASDYHGPVWELDASRQRYCACNN